MNDNNCKLNLDQLSNRYLDAKEFVIEAGFSWELDWQVERCFENLTESEFLKETAWVILSSGFRESVVRKLFPRVSEAFLCWQSSKDIHLAKDYCSEKALSVFNNPRKINAICSIVSKVALIGFSKIKTNIEEQHLDFLMELPFIGPATGLHLLKNIGLPLAKPDRHLLRIASATGFDSVQDLCKTIKDLVGDSIPEVDVVLWRYATIEPNYISNFINIEH